MFEIAADTADIVHRSISDANVRSSYTVVTAAVVADTLHSDTVDDDESAFDDVVAAAAAVGVY